MSQYTIKIDYQPEITISRDELINQIKDNRIPSTALVRKADTAEWQPLSSYPEFLYQTPPPLPKNFNQEQIITNAKLHEKNKTTIPKYFLPVGRIGRGVWLLRNTINFFAFSLLVILLNNAPEALKGFGVIIGFIFYIYLIIITSAKRLHDLNVTGWLAPIVFIPLVPLFLLILSGTDASNRFGDKSNDFWDSLFKS